MKLTEAFVEIKLRARGFFNSLKRTERQTERSARKVGGAFDKMGKKLLAGFALIGSKLAAALALGVILIGIKKISDELDQLAKRARTIGLSPQQLAGFGFAVGQTTGLSSRAGQIALERFTKRSSEGLLGQGEAASVLKALGLDTDEFERADPLGRFVQFADVLRSVNDRGQQLTYTQKLLGDEARLLLPLLDLNRKEFEALIQEQRDLRGGMNAASKASERINDAFARVTERLKSTGDQILTAVAPAIEKLSEWFIIASNAIRDFVNSVIPALEVFGMLNEGLEKYERLNAERERGGGGSSSGMGGSGRAKLDRLTLNTMLGSFNVPGQSVLSELKKIAATNKAIAEAVQSRRGVPLT